MLGHTQSVILSIRHTMPWWPCHPRVRNWRKTTTSNLAIGARLTTLMCLRTKAVSCSCWLPIAPTTYRVISTISWTTTIHRPMLFWDCTNSMMIWKSLKVTNIVFQWILYWANTSMLLANQAAASTSTLRFSTTAAWWVFTQKTWVTTETASMAMIPFFSSGWTSMVSCWPMSAMRHPILAGHGKWFSGVNSWCRPILAISIIATTPMFLLRLTSPKMIVMWAVRPLFWTRISTFCESGISDIQGIPIIHVPSMMCPLGEASTTLRISPRARTGITSRPRMIVTYMSLMMTLRAHRKLCLSFTIFIVACLILTLWPSAGRWMLRMMARCIFAIHWMWVFRWLTIHG